MEIKVIDGKVRVNISADLTAEELRDTLAKLAQAHGQITEAKTPDTKVAMWPAEDFDARLIDGGAQFSLKCLIGWVQTRMDTAQVGLLLKILTSGSVEVGAAKH